MPISDNDLAALTRWLMDLSKPDRFNNPWLKARKILGDYAGMTEAEVGAEPSRALRLARAKTHPDVGGRREEWDLVEQCARMLGILPTGGRNE